MNNLQRIILSALSLIIVAVPPAFAATQAETALEVAMISFEQAAKEYQLALAARAGKTGVAREQAYAAAIAASNRQTAANGEVWKARAALKTEQLNAARAAGTTDPLPADAIRVKTDVELTKALAKLKTTGGTIALESGLYQKFSIWNAAQHQYPKPLVIRSADTAKRARILGATISNVANLTLKYLDFGGPEFVPQYKSTTLLSITGVDKVMVTKVKFVGPGEAVLKRNGTGLTIRDATNAAVIDNDFKWLFVGMTAINVKNGQYSANLVHHNRSEGFNGVGLIDVVLENNKFLQSAAQGDAATGDHPDAIQIWTDYPKLASANVTIRNNYIAQSDGMTQGIFITSLTGLRHKNFLIENNFVYAAMGNGITLQTADNSIIRNNTVIRPLTAAKRPDLPANGPMIFVSESTNVRVSNNIAGYMMLANNQRKAEQSGYNGTVIENNIVPILPDQVRVYEPSAKSKLFRYYDLFTSVPRNVTTSIRPNDFLPDKALGVGNIGKPFDAVNPVLLLD